MTTLYVAGPIKGIVNDNFLAFANAQVTLENAGYDVLNPQRHGNGAMSWAGYMKLGLTDLFQSDGVALLTGWSASQGATLERHVAQQLGIPVHTMDVWIARAQERNVT